MGCNLHKLTKEKYKEEMDYLEGGGGVKNGKGGKVKAKGDKGGKPKLGILGILVGGAKGKGGKPLKGGARGNGGKPAKGGVTGSGGIVGTVGREGGETVAFDVSSVSAISLPRTNKLSVSSIIHCVGTFCGR